MFGNFLGYSEMHYFLCKDCWNSLLGIVWKIWATFIPTCGHTDGNMKVTALSIRRRATMEAKLLA